MPAVRRYSEEAYMRLSMQCVLLSNAHSNAAAQACCTMAAALHHMDGTAGPRTTGPSTSTTSLPSRATRNDQEHMVDGVHPAE